MIIDLFFSFLTFTFKMFHKRFENHRLFQFKLLGNDVSIGRLSMISLKFLELLLEIL
jgi:hypothetical protein